MHVGLTASVALVVGDADTAVALGSGDVPVLGTPRVVALVEQATVAAVRDALDAGQTTVGTHIDLEHLRPSAVGATVEARATLVTLDGRRLEFAVAVTQDGEEVARGRVVRQVVDRERFLSRL
ncbi:MAG TPA: hotdog domain-containing protein [Mycobacteriales bacterium]|jgi:predicted thioesterase|nr:hotdog domain-containing protein [Mycobacteriales bacterium]